MEKVQNLKKDALIKELKEKRVMELNEKGAAGSSAYQVAPCLAHFLCEIIKLKEMRVFQNTCFNTPSSFFFIYKLWNYFQINHF